MIEKFEVQITANSSDLQKDVKKAEDKIKDFSKESKKASEVVDKAFESIKNSVKTAMTATTAAMAAVGTAIVGVTENTRDYRNAQSKLTTAFKTAGSNAETARKVYSKLNSVLGDSDVAVEAANHLAKLTTNEQDLEKWTKICTGVYATFGDSLPIEGLTEAANETAKTGALTGGLADALNWAGINEKEFQAQLDACSTEQERQNVIMDTLINTYSSAATEFEKTNASIIEANEATDDWNNTMAEIGGAFEPVLTEVKKLGTEVLKSAKEPLTDFAEFITDDLIPGMMDAAGWISDNKAEILGVIAGITAALVTHKAATVAAKLAEEGLTVAILAKTAAQKAANAIMAATPAGLVLTAMAALTAGVLLYVEATVEAAGTTSVLTEAEKELIEESSKAADQFRDMKTANDESIGAFQATMDHTTDLANELLSLADASGKVKEADEIRAQFILNELNEALGTEYTMVDGVIQQYDDLKTSIYDVIAAKTANSLLETRNEEYLAALQNENDALHALTAAQKDYDAQLETTKQAESKYLEANAKLQAALESASTEAEYRALRESATYRESLRVKYEAEKKKLDETQKAYDDAAADYGMYYDTITEYENAAMEIQKGNYDDAINMLTNKGEAFFDYADDVSEATKKAVDALYKEAVDAGIEAARTKENFENGVEGYTEEMVEEAEKAYEDALGAWENAYNDANGLGKDFGDGAKKGMNNTKIPERSALLYDDTMKEWDGASSKGIEVGEDLGEGVKKGLNNKESSLLTRARSLISSIWSAMKREAESNSPSKKTMRLGEDLGAGLEIGINDSTQDVVKSAQSMVRKTILPIEGTITGVSWNNVSGIFNGANLDVPVDGAMSGNIQDIAATQWVNQLADVMGANNTPIILQVDGKTFAETSISTINSLTRQTGQLALNLV